MQAFALGLFLGCFFLVWAPAGLDGRWLLASLSALLAAMVWLRPAWLVLSGFLLGGLLSTLTVHQQLNQDLAWESGQVTVLEGRVKGLVEEEGGRLRFDFQPLDGSGRSRGRLLRVSWPRPALMPRSGEVWQLPLRLDSSEGTPLPGAFDRDRWLFRQGLAGSARVDRRRTAVRLQSAGPGVAELRGSVSRAVSQALAGRPEAALIRGVTVGDRSGFSPDHWHVLNATGTTHLVAISGLHIGLVGGFVLWLGHLLTRGLPSRVPATVAAAGLGLLAAAAYATLAGFALPTQRALLMFSVLVLLFLLRRRTGTLAGLSLAAAGVLLIDPLAVMDAGFYLSFALVAMVLMVVSAGDRPPPWVAFLKVQWVTGLAVLPLLVLLFGSGPLTGPLANALAVPVFSLLVVPISLLGALFWSLGLLPLAQGSWWLAAEVLARLWPVLAFLADGPMLGLVAEIGRGWVFTGLLTIAALLLPGPVWARALLLCALMPALLGALPDRHARWQLQHWALPAGGHAWSIQKEERRLLWLDVSRGDLRPALNRWLAERMKDEQVGLVLNPRGPMGPASLDPILALSPSPREAPMAWPVLMPDPDRASPGPARHCHGISLAGWQFQRWHDADGEAVCRVVKPGAEASLLLGGEQVRLLDKQGRAIWQAEAGDWRETGEVTVSQAGRVHRSPPRAYWWRP